MKLRLSNGIVINPMGLKGGIALLCHHEANIEIVNYSQYHIHAKVLKPETSQHLYANGFYTNPNTSKIHESWDLLSKLKEH